MHFYDNRRPGWEASLGSTVTEALVNATEHHAPFAGNQNLGLFNYFPTDGESLREALLRAVEHAQQRIALVGWGLALISEHSRTLMNAVKRRVEVTSALEAHILLPKPDHPGLVARIQEEARSQSVAIVADWPNVFFKFGQELLDVAPAARQRVFVRRLGFLPTAAVLQIDDLYFFRPYGPPNRGGWASPWLACDTRHASSSWADYLKNLVEFAINDAALGVPG